MPTRVFPRTRTLTPTLLLGFAGLVMAVAAVWWHTLSDYFLGDDFAYISLYSKFPLLEWPTLFVSEWSQGIWGYRLPEVRPFAALSFIVDANLWGANPLGFHITNLVLHLLNTGLVVAIAFEWSRGHWGALIAGALFSLHPVHAEAVTWITGRVDLISTFFYLSAVYSFGRFRTTGRSWYGAAVVFACFAGAFSKEFCLTLPLMLVAYDLCCHRGTNSLSWRTLWPYPGCLAAILVYGLCRHIALGNSAGAPASLFESGWSAAFFDRQFQYLAWLAEISKSTYLKLAPHAQLLFTTCALGAVVICSVFDRLPRFNDTRTVRAHTLLFFVVIWYAIATCPLIVTYVAKRHLYLASAGTCVGLGLLCDRLISDRRIMAGVFFAAAISHCWWMHDSLRFWHQAAVISRSAQEAVSNALAASPKTTNRVLLLDVPESYRGAWVWGWAYPFAARPPFTLEALDTGHEVLTRPAVYAQAQVWSQQTLVKKLATAAGPGRLLTVDDLGTTSVLDVSGERMQTASAAFSNETLSADLQWRRFVEALRQ